jgi:hypothetical protein
MGCYVTEVMEIKDRFMDSLFLINYSFSEERVVKHMKYLNLWEEIFMGKMIWVERIDLTWKNDEIWGGKIRNFCWDVLIICYRYLIRFFGIFIYYFRSFNIFFKKIIKKIVTQYSKKLLTNFHHNKNSKYALRLFY